MRFLSILRTSLTLLAVAATGLAQQQRPTSPLAPPATSGATLAKGKVAVINTAVLQQQVGEYKAKIDVINKQFEPRTKDLQSKADRITALETTLKTQSQTLSPATVAEQTDMLERMKREYRRQAEDMQAEGEKALTQALNPVKEKLGKFLEDFTAKRGIVLLIDLASAFESNTVLWFDRRSDITQEFINEYNKAHPVPAAAPSKP